MLTSQCTPTPSTPVIWRGIFDSLQKEHQQLKAIITWIQHAYLHHNCDATLLCNKSLQQLQIGKASTPYTTSILVQKHPAEPAVVGGCSAACNKCFPVMSCRARASQLHVKMKRPGTNSATSAPTQRQVNERGHPEALCTLVEDLSLWLQKYWLPLEKHRLRISISRC